MARWWVRTGLVLVGAVAPVCAAAALPGCGSTTITPDGGTGASGGSGGGGGGGGEEPQTTVLHPNADPLPGESECTVTITTGIPIKKALHVETCSAVEYATNPPSGGNHWPVWAAFASYDVVVPREMYVHDMEHGAVILLHRCQGECPEVLTALAAARAAVSGDALCLQVPGGPTERVVTTPDPLLNVPIAAAAWGATYTATCVDTESLNDFVKARYGKGTEHTCAAGKLVGAPGGGAPDCGGGSGGGADGSGGAGGSGTGGAGAGTGTGGG